MKTSEFYKVYFETSDILQGRVKDFRCDTENCQRYKTWYKGWFETSDTIQKMVRDFRHGTEDG